MAKEKLEEDYQADLARYCREQGYCFHMNNNSGKGCKDLANLKRMGLEAGTPDIEINEPNKDYHGLFIELKKSGGKASPLQNVKLKELNQRGYRATICYEDDWRKEIESYFNNLSVEDENVNNMAAFRFHCESLLHNQIENFYIRQYLNNQNNKLNKSDHNRGFANNVIIPILHVLWMCRDSRTALAFYYWLQEIKSYADEIFDMYQNGKIKVCVNSGGYWYADGFEKFLENHPFIKHFNNR